MSTNYNIKKYTVTSILLSIISFILIAYRFLPEFYPNSYFVYNHYSDSIIWLTRQLYIVVAIIFVIYTINRLTIHVQITNGSLIFKKNIISPIKTLNFKEVDLKISNKKYLFLFSDKIELELNMNMFDKNSAQKLDMDIKNALYSQKRKIIMED